MFTISIPQAAGLKIKFVMAGANIRATGSGTTVGSFQWGQGKLGDAQFYAMYTGKGALQFKKEITVKVGGGLRSGLWLGLGLGFQKYSH